MRVLKLALISILLVASSAWAGPEDARLAEAKQHYESGLAHFNLQEYKQAIDEFQAAYRLKPDPVFLYNLGQAYRLDQNPERALYFYRAYLRSVPDAANRQEVEDRIASLENLIAQQKSVQTAPPDHTLPPAEKPATAPEPVAQKKAPIVANVEQPVAPPPAAKPPIYKRWWLWTIVGVVAAGAAVGIAVGVTQSGPAFNAGLGTIGPAALGVRY